MPWNRPRTGVLFARFAKNSCVRVKFVAMPKPRRKKLNATTPKGGVATIVVYPTTSNISAPMRVLARPMRCTRKLMKKAAAMKPRALQRKMVDTVA
jgi:hypothetical protein